MTAPRIPSQPVTGDLPVIGRSPAGFTGHPSAEDLAAARRRRVASVATFAVASLGLPSRIVDWSADDVGLVEQLAADVLELASAGRWFVEHPRPTGCGDVEGPGGAS